MPYIAPFLRDGVPSKATIRDRNVRLCHLLLHDGSFRNVKLSAKLLDNHIIISDYGNLPVLRFYTYYSRNARTRVSGAGSG